MAFFYYDVRVPDDVFTPREFCDDELDALLVAPDRRDSCKNYFAEFKMCIAVQH
jgi:hypothetical protein